MKIRLEPSRSTYRLMFISILYNDANRPSMRTAFVEPRTQNYLTTDEIVLSLIIFADGLNTYVIVHSPAQGHALKALLQLKKATSSLIELNRLKDLSILFPRTSRWHFYRLTCKLEELLVINGSNLHNRHQITGSHMWTSTAHAR